MPIQGKPVRLDYSSEFGLLRSTPVSIIAVWFRKQLEKCGCKSTQMSTRYLCETTSRNVGEKYCSVCSRECLPITYCSHLTRLSYIYNEPVSQSVSQSVSQWNTWPAAGRSALQDLRSRAILQASLALSHNEPHEYNSSGSGICVCPHNNLKTIANICILLDSHVDWKKISDEFTHQDHTPRSIFPLGKVAQYLSRVVRVNLQWLLKCSSLCSLLCFYKLSNV